MAQLIRMIGFRVSVLLNITGLNPGLLVIFYHFHLPQTVSALLVCPLVHCASHGSMEMGRVLKKG